MAVSILLAWCTIYGAIFWVILAELQGFYRLPEEAGVPKEIHCCKLGSVKYYFLCGIGGAFACGLTHLALVPIDLIKCRIQVNSIKYPGIIIGLYTTYKEEGLLSFDRGWLATWIGYSIQGFWKFGLYEYFKDTYLGLLNEENAYMARTLVYLLASASAEFFADFFLAPFEAVKVRAQTQSHFPRSFKAGLLHIWRDEHYWGFYKGLLPLWLRQIPYTMMKFASFERTVELLYMYVVPKPRVQCSKPEQLLITFIAGCLAGVFCAIISQPADTVVSKLNEDKGSSTVEIARRLGIRGLFQGLLPRIFMIGVLCALQWFIYDAVKVHFRLPRPLAVHMPKGLLRERLKPVLVGS